MNNQGSVKDLFNSLSNNCSKEYSEYLVSKIADKIISKEIPLQELFERYYSYFDFDNLIIKSQFKYIPHILRIIVCSFYEDCENYDLSTYNKVKSLLLRGINRYEYLSQNKYSLKHSFITKSLPKIISYIDACIIV